MSATTLSKVAGLVIVGLTGHLITTALGRSLSGSTSSIFSVWPLRLPLDSGVMGLPLDSGVRWTLGFQVLDSWEARPVGVRALAGHFCGMGSFISVRPPFCKPFANGPVSTGLDRVG